MLPIANIPVTIGDQPSVVARVCFVDVANCRSVTNNLPRATSRGRPVDDAIEFVRLAAKRWNYYHRSGYAVSSAGELQERIRANPQCEVGFMLLVFLPGGEIGGGCFARRTWAGNILLDFLFAHPCTFSSSTGRSTLRGVGVGIMSVLASITLQHQGTELWGEATENSHGFYKKLKLRMRIDQTEEPIMDRFIFRRKELAILAKQIS
jgi:hypothetical protein